MVLISYIWISLRPSRVTFLRQNLRKKTFGFLLLCWNTISVIISETGRNGPLGCANDKPLMDVSPLICGACWHDGGLKANLVIYGCKIHATTVLVLPVATHSSAAVWVWYKQNEPVKCTPARPQGNVVSRISCGHQGSGAPDIPRCVWVVSL